ncbi:protein-glutamate O-methyltransferase CheR [Phenylobacterium sp. J367]|uniref:CheR family methyltransferase n=1 Tax=Phenylobacterium sp. J367 TaxID=2898435 RepID=UPI002151C8BC|nr:protein-glutamate O-methyltransferase CheR [Phenylobacterium sp. J367]MCR5877798.1 protein-glutamate O-methyltransferase CheR [Phenylobacterium sp. J367]
MTPGERAFVAWLCEQRAGLAVDADKAYLLESRLAPLARREGFGSVGELLQALRDREEEQLVWSVVEAMAQRDAIFLRDPPVFALLRDQVLPRLARQREGEAIRVWCAAAGSGQEVYSLAMMLADAPIAGARVELFASELAERQLEKAQSGLYTQFEVQRGLPARMLVRHFEKTDEAFTLSARIRQMVRWRRVNLIDDLSRLGQFDVVVCRQVLPAMTPDARSRALAGLTGATASGGCLVLDAGCETPAGYRPLGVAGVFAAEAEARAAA